ncbi:L,D-transpeptidase family protein [Marichromatium bheemlicum]|uniref:L,D-transpeptidase family protein n=1 Tax=Marichromatium bheemlicum TaxID=365339 RepID=UPI001FE5FCE7|nr:L,D-transpeptidase family protein [Marichromatium bheemlicum]
MILVLLAGCASAPQPELADRVVVHKSSRTLELWHGQTLLRSYRVALGGAPVGHKFRSGDERTPIGDYVLDWRNPHSNFHKSIHISYPNARDRATARALGYDPGGMIMIHGQPNHIRSERVRREYATRDWTDGCIAVQDHEMDEIWRMVRDGTPIRILP